MATVMTDRQKASLYADRLKRGEEARDRWAPDARRRLQVYKNLPNEEQFTIKGHRISTPTGPAIIDSMYSSLTAVDVEVSVTPQALGTDTQARVAEAAIMQTWREAKVPAKTRSAVKDALIVSFGAVKVGYDHAEHQEIVRRPRELISEELAAVYNSFRQSGQEPPSPQDALAMVDTHEEVTIVDRDRIVVDYVPWQNVVWDPTAKRYEDIRWIAQITYLPIEEVRGNPAWREYVKEHYGSYKFLDELQPNAKLAAVGEDDGQPTFIGDETVEVMSERAVVKVVEMWDLTLGSTFCTFVDGQDWLLDEDVNPFGFNDDMEDRNPYVFLTLRTDPTHVRGISDMELIEPSLYELNRYRSVLINYLERHAPKLVGPSRAMTQTGVDALESKDPKYVGLEEGFTANDVQPLNPPALPQEMFDMATRIENQIREATGVSEVMRGIFPDRKRTATETAEVVAASSARQSEKRTLMEDFYTNIARRILQLAQTYYKKPRIARLVGDVGDDVWEWDNESVTMEADLEVVLTPKQPRDRVWREERAMKLVNFVAPLPEANRLNLVKKVLLDMGFSEREIREVIRTEEEQDQEAARQAQNQAAAAALEAEGAAVGQASGDPNVPGGVNDPLSMAQAMGPEGVMADAAESMTGPMDVMLGP